MTGRRPTIGPSDDDTLSVGALGVDEQAVVPWPIVLRRRLAARVPVDRRWAVLWVVLAGMFTVSVTFTLLVVSLDRIAGELHTSSATLTWAITGPMLAFGVVGPAFGKAGDLWGQKRIFVGGLLLAAVFAAASAVAWNALSLIVFRVLSATAGSACGPAAMAYINRMFGPGERVKPLGYWSFVGASAPVIGVVAGGPVVEAVGWRVIFMVQAPLCLVAAVLALWLLPSTDRILGARFDFAGAGTLGMSGVMALTAISQGRFWGWTSAATLGCLMMSAVAAVAFVRVERRHTTPLVRLDWFRTRNIAFPILAQMLANFAYLGGLFLVPQVLGARGFGYGESTVGYLVISRPIAFAVVAPLAGVLSIRFGERLSGMAGAALVVASMLWWASITLGAPVAALVAATGLSGLGLGMMVPGLTALAANAVDPRDLGVLGAMQQLAVQLGSVMGSAVMAAVSVEAVAANFGPFHLAFAIGAVAAGAAVLAAAMVRDTPRGDLAAR